MTWAEFQIRAFAYQRIEQRRDLRAREIAWASLIAPNADAKKLPKNKDSYWSIGVKQATVTKEMKERIKRAQEQYLKEKNGTR